jgi:hypothetical protein
MQPLQGGLASRHVSAMRLPWNDLGRVTLCNASHLLRFVYPCYISGTPQSEVPGMSIIGRTLLRAAAGLGVVLLLSGCVVYPAGPYYGGGYGYYGHPHYYRW